MPRDNKALGLATDLPYNPHVSHHRDGRAHVKSFGKRVFAPVLRQRPDSGFIGVEPLFAESFQPGGLERLPVVPTAGFAEVIEIPRNRVDPTQHYALVTHLLEPGKHPHDGPWLELVHDHTIRVGTPWIHVAFWRGVKEFASSDV
jgi:hypothetical protein